MRKLILNNYVLIIVLLILTYFSLTIGVLDFDIWALFNGSNADLKIALLSRIPRTSALILAGMGLSLSGLIMQAITNNRFVSPTTAGSMSFCKLGMLVAIIFFGHRHISAKILVAFLFGLAGSFIFLGIIEKLRYKNKILVPLVGMMLASVVDAITTFFGYNLDILANLQSWTMGSFALVSKGRYELLFLGIPFMFLAYYFANHFTLVSMGKSISTSLGVNYRQIMFLGLLIVAVIVASVVVNVGSISFVGLIIPNIVSLACGDNLKYSLGKCMLLGAIFLMGCDLLARIIIFPYELSISVIVAIIGSICFMTILMTYRKRSFI